MCTSKIFVHFLVLLLLHPYASTQTHRQPGIVVSVTTIRPLQGGQTSHSDPKAVGLHHALALPTPWLSLFLHPCTREGLDSLKEGVPLPEGVLGRVLV